jgi:hypothetical protein
MINFNNAESITIDGEDVQQITIDGTVVWTKRSAVVDSLVLSSNSQNVTVGGTINLECTVYDAEDNPIRGVSVSFYDNNLLIGSSTSNSNGVASFTYSNVAAGSCILTGIADNVTSNTVNITVSKLTPSISLSANSNTVTAGGSLVLSGSLLDNNNAPITGASIELYNGQSLLDTLTTDNNGLFSKTLSPTVASSMSLLAIFNGNNIFNYVNSTSVGVTVTPGPVASVTLAPSSGSVKRGKSLLLTALVEDAYNNDISGATVSLNKNEVVSSPVYRLFKNYSNVTIQGYSNGITLSVRDTNNYVYIDMKDNETSTFLLEIPEGANVAFRGSDGGKPIYSSETINIQCVNGVFTVNHVTVGTSLRMVFSAVGTYYMRSIVWGDFSEVDTAVSDSNGIASLTFTPSVAGTDILRAHCNGISSSNSSITVYDPTPTTLALEADKPIFMKDETCTLTATLLDEDDEAISGELVSFDFLDGSGGSVTDNIGTATTNALGVASVSFTGKGVGDLYIQSNCGILLSEIYVTDYINILDSASKFQSGFVDGVDGDYNYFTAPSSSHLRLSPLTNSVFPDKFKITFDYLKTSKRFGHLYFCGALNNTTYEVSFGSSSVYTLELYKRTNNSSETKLMVVDSSITSNVWNHIEVIFNQGVITVTNHTTGNTNTVTTDNSVVLSDYLAVYINNTFRFANIRIKAL